MLRLRFKTICLSVQKPVFSGFFFFLRGKVSSHAMVYFLNSYNSQDWFGAKPGVRNSILVSSISGWGQSSFAIFWCLPRHFIRKLGHNSWDSNLLSDMGFQHCKHLLNVLHRNSGPFSQAFNHWTIVLAFLAVPFIGFHLLINLWSVCSVEWQLLA